MVEKIFLCSHAAMADGLLSAVEAIVGRDPRVKAYTLDRYEAPSAIEAEVERELSQAESCAILCDIKGGSVHNALMRFCCRPGVYLITGMNLAMAIELISAPEDTELSGRCRQALEAGMQDQILFDQAYVSRILNESGDADDL